MVSRDSDLATLLVSSTRSSSKRARRPRCGPSRPPNHSRRRSSGCAASDCEGGDALSLEPRHGLGADAGDQAGGVSAEALPGLGRGELEEAVRLVGVRGHLGHQLVGPDPDRAAQARVLVHRCLDAPGRRAVPRQSREVHVGLVQAHHLEDLHVAAQYRHHVARAGAIELEVGREEHGVRAQSPRPLGRSGGEDPEAARLVAGGGHHRTRTAARHHHREAAQVGAALQLDPDVEGVHVHVGDDASRGLVGHHLTVAPEPVGADRLREERSPIGDRASTGPCPPRSAARSVIGRAPDHVLPC